MLIIRKYKTVIISFLSGVIFSSSLWIIYVYKMTKEVVKITFSIFGSR